MEVVIVLFLMFLLGIGTTIVYHWSKGHFDNK